MASHNFERLKAHILPLSMANDFESARQEWRLEAIEISEEWDHCPCGQEIKEHCYIRNGLNGNSWRKLMLTPPNAPNVSQQIPMTRRPWNGRSLRR